MQFRLTYEGELLGASRTDTRAGNKHALRCAFHPQLKRLWEVMPNLAPTMKPELPDLPFYSGAKHGDYNRIDQLANRFRCGDYRLAPLVVEELSLLCGIHILFLRPDPPGQLIQSGDIDNRLKTVFDALRVPQDAQELAGAQPKEGENPLFCLLQDDKLITQVSVETDLLLEPIGGKFNANDCRLVITVNLRPATVLLANLGFA